MTDEPTFEAVLVMADEMLSAGVEQLKLYDPEKEPAHLAVARIYFAMECVREAIEGGTAGEMPGYIPVDKSKLN